MDGKRAVRQATSFLSSGQRATHTYIIGQPGTGKSRAIESWVMQDILAGRGIAVVDPHGELFNNLMARLAHHPAQWNRLVIIDPCDSEWVVGINPLQAAPGFSTERVAQFMTDIMVKIWNLEVNQAPRLLWLMNNSFLALAEAGLKLVDLPRFLLESSFRASTLQRTNNPVVRAYFEHEYPQSRAATHQWATPLLNKIGGLIFDSDIRLTLSAEPPLNFRALMDQSKILLVNIPKGILGEGASALLGAFIVARMQKAALSRAAHSYRQPFYLYLDEFQNYTTSNIVDILAESRKYALSMTLAHQYLDQLSTDIKNAVLNTSGTIVSFRVGHKDAVRLADEMFFNRDGSISRVKIGLGQNGLWPHISPRREQSRNTHEERAALLTGLRLRDFWAKRRGVSKASSHRTFTVPDVKMTADINAIIRRMYALSGQIYGEAKHRAKARTAAQEGRPSSEDSGLWSS